jgi:hypothetical protein
MLRFWRLTTVNKLPQAYPLLVPSKAYSSKFGSGVATILSHLKSTQVFKEKFSSGLEILILTFELTHITCNHGACSFPSGLERLKDRTIKLSAASQVF